MKGITRKSIKEDLEIIERLHKKYADPFHEEHREDRPAHMFNQLPLIRKAVSNAELGLHIVRESLGVLDQLSDLIVEDEKQ